MQREIIFNHPSNSEIRVRCLFGKPGSFTSIYWTFYSQKKSYYKKYLFFGEIKYRWVTFNECWNAKSYDTMDELRETALRYLKEDIEDFDIENRLIQKAINLK